MVETRRWRGEKGGGSGGVESFRPITHNGEKPLTGHHTAVSTLFFTHPACAGHDPGPQHPESPRRLHAIWQALADRAFDGLIRHEAPLGDLACIQRVHPKAYVDGILAAIPHDKRAWLDADTVISPQSGEAALRAVGAVCAAVDAVAGDEARNAFCAVRPPGHHAEPTRAMGFCLFNNVAIAARHARAAHGLERIAVVDFDVHHGNGTQAVFWDDAAAFYASSHQMPAYPGTGMANERGAHDTIVNVPLAPGAGSPAFRDAYSNVILPRLAAFGPDIVILSAGFDAHARDPLAQLMLKTSDFEWITRQVMDLAGDACGGRIVSVLEGGYDLGALAEATAAHVGALMGK